jgi:dnd system-associated protein 4
MTVSSDVRVRRPQAYEELMQKMRNDSGFSTYRDILLFAAGLGVTQQRRLPFDSSAEPIRYDTLADPPFAEALINMIAALEHPNDANVMSMERLAERVRAFEEYANGGLEYLQEQMNTRHQPVELVVISLVTEALVRSGAAEAASIDELLSGVPWLDA